MLVFGYCGGLGAQYSSRGNLAAGFQSHMSWASCAYVQVCLRAQHIMVAYTPLPSFCRAAAQLLFSRPNSLPLPSALSQLHGISPAVTFTRMSTTTSAEAVPTKVTDDPTPNERIPLNDEPVHPKDETIQLGNLAANIVPHILNLYNCSATAADYEMYDSKARFEDPLMQAHGVKQIKSAFYSIPKVFKEAKMLDYTVTEVESAPNSGEISIDNLQRYRFGSKTIDVVSLIKLQVENGKVVSHVDMWNKKPLLDRETVKVPLVGRLVEKLRRGNMLMTHLFMGGGKDPKPQP